MAIRDGLKETLELLGKHKGKNQTGEYSILDWPSFGDRELSGYLFQLIESELFLNLYELTFL